jgi:hypothetical protein
MTKHLEPHQQEINQWLQRLDDVSRGIEARWGVGRLERLCTPAMAVKWNAHWEKLNDAIQRQHLADVATLAQGAIRGWQALVNDAAAQGHQPLPPDVWETHLPDTGEVLHLVKTITDARAPHPEGVVVISLQEVAAIISAQRNRVYLNRPAPEPEKPAPAMPAEFWKNGGDKIDF